MCDKASEVSATLIYETAEEQEEKREVAEQEAEAPTLAYEAGLLGDREALSATLAYDESAAVDAKGFHTSKSTAHHQEDAHMTQVYDKIEETCAEPTLRYDDGGGDADGNQEDKGPECSDDGGGDDDATEMCAPTQIYEPALPQEGHSIVNDEIETIGSIEKFETTTDISADVAVDELLNQMVSANSSVVHENEEDRDSSPTSFVGLVLPYTNDGNDTDGGDGDGGDVGDSELHSITEKSNMVEDVADKKEEGEKEEEEDATQLPTDNEDVMEVAHQDNKENEQAHSAKGEPADTTITTLRSVPEEDQIFGSSTQLYSLPESVPLGEVMHSSPEDRSGTSRVEASLEDEDGEEETSKYTGASLCILSQVAESTSWDTTDERYKADENNSSKRKRVASIPPTQESKRSAEADERANKKQRCDDGDRGRNNGAESNAVPQHSLQGLQQKIKEESEEVVEASAEEEDWPLDNVTKDGHEEPQRETGTGVIHEKIKVESTKRGGGRRKQTEAKSSAKAPKQKGTNRKVGKNEESTSLLRAKEEEDEEENVAKSGRKTRTKEKKVKAPCRAIKGKRMASKPSSCEPSLIEIPRVMFTGIVDPKRAKVIADLGGKIVEDPHQSTHLVTDKVHRTIKFLACMGRGNAIVSFRWIDKCNKEGFFVEETPFFLKDMAGERKWNFSLPASLQFARSRPLLQGLSFYASLHTRPDPESLGVIVTAAGGRMVGKPEQPYSSSSDSNVIIISCAEDEDVWRPLHDQKGYPIYTTEFILLGILQQRLEWESNLLVRHQQDLESQPDQSLASPKSRRGRRRR
ncbi:Mediator of DNA damage checkpoint protein 1 [Balamuthia mandrillaris]